ncbi:unnamed protein product, partial [marine sediment metagenome]
LPANPNTPAAEHALVGVVDKYRAAGIHREFPQEFPETLGLKLSAKVMSYFLKLAGAAAGAMGTVHRMTRQKQLKGGAHQP